MPPDAQRRLVGDVLRTPPAATRGTPSPRMILRVRERSPARGAQRVRHCPGRRESAVTHSLGCVTAHRGGNSDVRRLLHQRIPWLVAAVLLAAMGFGGLATGRALRQAPATTGIPAPATNEISGRLGTGPTPTATHTPPAPPSEPPVAASPRAAPAPASRTVPAPQPAPPASARPDRGPKHDKHGKDEKHDPGPPAHHPPHGGKPPPKKP